MVAFSPVFELLKIIKRGFSSWAYNLARGLCCATCARKSKHHPVSSLCVCLCVLFFQSVIVIPLAQSVIAVMAQDFVYVRRALQGLSVRSVYPAICGTMAANVSRTFTTQLPTALSSLSLSLSPSLLLSLCYLCQICLLSVWLLSSGWNDVLHMRRTAHPITRANPVN